MKSRHGSIRVVTNIKRDVSATSQPPIHPFNERTKMCYNQPFYVTKTQREREREEWSGTTWTETIIVALLSQPEYRINSARTGYLQSYNTEKKKKKKKITNGGGRA